MMPRRNEPGDVFTYVDTRGGDPDVCWPWTGALGGRDNERGYFSVGGVKWLAHRLVYTLVHGEIPAGQVVRHKCDNPVCCNIAHMELGSQSDNENDKYKRDRSGLPVATVREIKRLLEVTSFTQSKIAYIVSARYGKEVSRESVRNIKNGLRRTQEDATTQEEIAAKSISGEAVSLSEKEST
jgi:hypothetical protein